MEEKKKVWIRGRKGCGKEIVKILEQLGAKNALRMGCNDENTIYFIDHKNRIFCVLAGSEAESIIMDNYREIKLPRQDWRKAMIDDGILLIMCFIIGITAWLITVRLFFHDDDK